VKELEKKDDQIAEERAAANISLEKYIEGLETFGVDYG
jgi:hypothetical protein